MFWTVNFSDPHAASSFDLMHNNAHGIGGKHIWPELQRHINNLCASGEAIEKVNLQFVPTLLIGLYLMNNQDVCATALERSFSF